MRKLREMEERKHTKERNRIMQNMYSPGRSARGKMTEKVHENLFGGEILDLDEWKTDDLRSAVNPEERPVFLQGVIERLGKMGASCAVTDSGEADCQTVLAEVKRRFRERTGEACPRTIQEWFRGTPPGDSRRKNLYDLCYALEMNAEETAEFFRRYYLTIPFNFRDRTDAVFFYCLLRGKTYDVIRGMLHEAEGFEATGRNPADSAGSTDSAGKADSTDSAGRADAPGCAGTARTAEIGRQIAGIDDDREFLRYLSGHCCSREQQYRTARAEIIRLMDRCGKDTASGLHEEVMGFRYQDTLLARQKRQKLLPKEFTRSLPTDRTFLDIRKGKKETYETMRKTLIILLFYDFYHAAREAAEEPDDDTVRSNAEDFYQEANEVLARCGMPLLYERHPFDRLMLFCALKKSPLDAFYGLNDRRYSAE